MKLTLRNIVPIVLLALLGIAFAIAFNARERAPAAEFTSLTGDKLSLAGLKGKVVLVNFWATSCAGCVAEMPKLVATYNKYRGRGFETIAVAMSYDPPNYVVAYSQKNALPFTVSLDPTGVLAQSFKDVQLTPTSFLIDKQGRIIQRVVGEPDFARLHALIEKELAA